MRRTSASRRRFLRGALGLVALPLFDSLFDRKATAAPFPKRFLVMFTPNGAPKANWASTSNGSETDFTLSPILGALQAHKQDLLILQGIDMESSYHGPGDGMHLNGIGHMLTGTELVELADGSLWGGGISADQFIAQKVGTNTKFQSLEAAVDEQPGTIRARISYLGKAQPVPPEYDPQKLYSRVFDDADPQKVAIRHHVLDGVSDDLRALQKELGRDDRQKLEAHLDAVTEIEKKLDVSAKGCAVQKPDFPSMPTYEQTGRLHMDLLVLAMSCDLARVGSLMWSISSSNIVFDWLGIQEAHHSLSHVPATDATAQFKLTDINRWYALQFGYLLDKLKSVPEGGGTMLDNTVVFWSNELSDGVIHDRRSMPYLLAGQCGGAIKTGRLVQYQAAKHNDLLVSLCNAMDVPVKTFGNPAYCSGPLAGVLSG